MQGDGGIGYFFNAEERRGKAQRNAEGVSGWDASFIGMEKIKLG